MAADVQTELVTYLEWFKRKQESEDRRSDDTRMAIVTLTNQMQLLSQKLDTVNMVFDERLKGQAARLDALEQSKEDTGVHNLRRLEEELKETKAAADRKDQEGKRSRWEIIKLVVMVVLSLIGGGGAVEAVHLLSH